MKTTEVRKTLGVLGMLLFFLFPSILFAQSASTAERAALQSIYTNTGGAGWTNQTNWNFGDPCTNGWYGVTCDGVGRVVAVNLPGNNLIGNIPAAIGDLFHLRRLNLSNNGIQSIDSNIGDLTDLDVVKLENNNLISLPAEIGDLITLDTLDLSGNQLASIPGEMGQMIGLEFLDLSNNQLTCLPSGMNTLCSKAGLTVLLNNNAVSLNWTAFCTTGQGVCNACPPPVVNMGGVDTLSTAPNQCNASLRLSTESDFLAIGVTFSLPACYSFGNISFSFQFLDSLSNGTFIPKSVSQSGGSYLPPVGNNWVNITASVPGVGSTTKRVKFFVKDDIPPIAKCDNSINISLTIGGGLVYGRVDAIDLDEGSSDNCGLAKLEVRRRRTSCTPGGAAGTWTNWAPFVDVYCCDVGVEIEYELRATDISGNTNVCDGTFIPEFKLTVSCVAPPNVTVGCNDPRLDNLASFGAATGTGLSCLNISVRELSAVRDLKQCGNGTITRRFQVVRDAGTANEVVLDNCEQVITVLSNNRYYVCFPPDVVSTCGQNFSVPNVTYSDSGCDLMTVSSKDEEFIFANSACSKVFRTYRVINWCEYDGKSAPVVVGRDYDAFNGTNPLNINGDGSPGNNGICVIVARNFSDNRPDTVWYDADSNPYNNVPNASGYWTRIISGGNDPAQASYYVGNGSKWGNHPNGGTNNDRRYGSYGYWQYTQHIVVKDDQDPEITLFAASDTICTLDNVNCDESVQFTINVSDNCSDASGLRVTRIEIDLNQNGTYDRSIDPSVVNTTGFPNLTFTAPNLPLGAHTASVWVTDGCGNVGRADYDFVVKDCKKPNPICITNITLSLMQMEAGVDADGDGDVDPMAMMIQASELIASPIFDCTGTGTARNSTGQREVVDYYIARQGEYDPNDRKTELVLTCDDLVNNQPTVVRAEIHGVDGAGNDGFCVIDITVRDNMGMCGPVSETPNPQVEITPEAEQVCANDQLTCEGDVNFTFLLTDGCNSGTGGTVQRIRIDLYNSGDIDQTLDHRLVDSRDFPLYRFKARGIPIGRHRLIVDMLDACGNAASGTRVFEIIDCAPPELTCINVLRLDLQALNPNRDFDGDGDIDKAGIDIWADDFITGTIYDCTGTGAQVDNFGRRSVNQIYIARKGQFNPNDRRTSLYLTCDDPIETPIPVEIYAYDGAGNFTSCESTVILQDSANACMIPENTPPQVQLVPKAEVVCLNDDLECTADRTFSFTVSGGCTSGGNLQLQSILLDTNGDGSFDQSLDVREVVTTDYPTYTYTIRDLPIGTYRVLLTVVDGCGQTASTNFSFQVRDCSLPELNCITALTLDLQALPVNTDFDGDGDFDKAGIDIWADDFLRGPVFDCTGQGTNTDQYGRREVTQVYIARKGQVDMNNLTTSLFMTCDDLAAGSLLAEILAFDGAGNKNSCEVSIVLRDTANACMLGVAGPPTVTIGTASTVICASESQGCDADVAFLFDVGGGCVASSRDIRVTYLGVDLYNSGDVDRTFPLNQVLDDTYPQLRFTAGDLPIGTHRMIVTVTDGCSQTAQASLVFEVRDCTAPQLTCVSQFEGDLEPLPENTDFDGDGDLDKAGLEVTVGDLLATTVFDCSGSGSTTNSGGQREVTDVYVSRAGQFDKNNKVKSLKFTCDDLSGSPIEVEIHAFDGAGNHSSCLTKVVLLDTDGDCTSPVAPEAKMMIAGAISTEDQRMQPNTMVRLSGKMSMIDYTSESGQYEFPDLLEGYNYKVEPKSGNDYLNGLSTADVIRLQQHLIGVKALTSPYQLIAADLNNSGNISIADLVLLRRLVLQAIGELPDNTSWRYVDAAHQFADPQNPWMQAIPEAIEVNGLKDDRMDVSFVAVKIGDLNLSAAMGAAPAPELRTGASLALSIPDQSLEPGQTYRLPVYLDDMSRLAGYQFALMTTGNEVVLQGVEPGLAEASNLVLNTGAGWLTVSHTALDKPGAFLPQAADEPLFHLLLRVATPVRTREALFLQPRFLAAEGYEGDDRVRPIELEFTGQAVDAARPAQLLAFPNPFTDQTTLQWWLPNGGAGTLSVFNAKGQEVFRQEGVFGAGFNELILTQQQLRESGVYYCRLVVGEQAVVRKVLRK